LSYSQLVKIQDGRHGGPFKNFVTIF